MTKLEEYEYKETIVKYTTEIAFMPKAGSFNDPVCFSFPKDLEFLQVVKLFTLKYLQHRKEQNG